MERTYNLYGKPALNGNDKSSLNFNKKFEDGTSIEDKLSEVRDALRERKLREAEAIQRLQDNKRIFAPSGLPDEFYQCWPKIWQDFFNTFEQGYERDVVVMATLPVIASAFSNTRMTNRDGYISPVFYNIIVAQAGLGKGVSSWAAKLGDKVHKRIKEDSKAEKTAWEQQKELAEKNKYDFEDPEPPEQSFFLAVDASRAALVRDLEANNGRGLLWSTEIDTLNATEANEWGILSDLLRQGFHHERITVSRKDGRHEIENPRFSMFMSGTPAQFKKLIKNQESGLFSRFSVYIFSSPVIWKSHRPTGAHETRINLINQLSSLIDEIECKVSKVSNPVSLFMHGELWDVFDNVMSDILRAGFAPATVQRAGLTALRVAMSLRLLGVKNFDNTFGIREVDIKAGLLFAQEW